MIFVYLGMKEEFETLEDLFENVDLKINQSKMEDDNGKWYLIDPSQAIVL